MAGIYLHIPFCKQACSYCNFHFSTTGTGRQEMVAALLAEAEMQRDFFKDDNVTTIYFGGGTPSLLTAEEIKFLIDGLVKIFGIECLDECTLEANPDDLSKPYLHALQSTPISRFSIGVQSFHDADLRYMKRAHTAQEADYAIKLAQDLGFTNLSIDLIYGTPGLTNEGWSANLQKFHALKIPHLSSYALTVEEGTALHSNIKKNKTTAPTDTAFEHHFLQLTDFADANGYDHYEISNFALPDQYAIHNTNYWKGVPYLGLGPSAHSYNGKVRSWNVANNSLYLQQVLKNKNLLPEVEILTEIQILNEYIMTSLRTMWGTEIDKLRRLADDSVIDKILEDAQPFLDDGRLLLADNILKLSTNGKMYADAIASELFFAEP